MTADAPRLAILVTYHNEGELLRRCLSSLAAQTRPVDEILVYDDASMVPPSPHVPGGLPVRILRGETNIGPARARNVLLKAATGSYVHFHDADDAFEPSWSQRVIDALQGSDADAAFTEVTSVSESGLTRANILGLAALGEGDDLARFCIRGSMLVPAGTYRRQLLQRLGGYRETLWQSEDWDFHIRLACARPKYVVLNDSLVRIYLRHESRSRNTAQVWNSAVDAIRCLASEIPAMYRDDLAEASAKAGSHLFRAGAKAEARAAFALARALGKPVHASEPRLYTAIARHAGQEWAERMGSLYRKCLPERVRGRLTQKRVHA